MLIAIGLLLCFARVESKLRQNIANDEAHGKTYPGFTIFDADGQFAKAIGPLYGKVNIHGLEFPIKYAGVHVISINVTSTVDIRSIYVLGEILFEGTMLARFDGSQNICKQNGIKCPVPAEVLVQKTLKIDFKEIGLFPGWYKGHLDLLTMDSRGIKYSLGSFRFKMKIQDN